MGNPALVVVTKSHHDSLAQELRAQGVNVDGAIERETYMSFDADKELDTVCFFDAVRGLRVAASKVGKKHPRVAICGERAGRLWADGKIDEALRLEQFADELAKNHAVDILCAYPLSSSRGNDDALKSILELHSAVHSN